MFRSSGRGWPEAFSRTSPPLLAGLVALFACGFGGGPADRAIAQQESEAGGAALSAQGRAVLTAMTIDGVTAYPMAELAPLYDDRLAREAGLDDLIRVAEAITAKYRADGYFLTRAAAPYKIADGQGRLVVYEGYVGEVAFEGDAVPAVGALFADLPDRRPLKLTDLDRRLSLAGDLPGVKVTARLEPILEDPARHRLVVRTEAQRLSASLYADNRGTESAGPLQVYARGALNSAVISGDQLALGVLTTPEDLEEFVQADLSYAIPLRGGARVRALVTASKAEGEADGFNAALGNESQSASLRLSVPVVRQRDRSLWLAATAEARRVEQNWSTGDYEDEILVARASVSGDRDWSGGYTTGFAQVSRGFGGFGGEPSDGRTRWDADARFWKINLYGSHYRDIGSKAGLFVAASGQWSPDPLLSSEEFSAGGLPVGRAYDYGEIMGDRGVGGQAELRVGWDPHLRPLTFFQTYAFFDGAKVWNYNAAPGWRSAALTSAGAGLRLVFDEVALRLEVAKPLTRTPYTQDDRGLRGFVSLSANF